MSGTLNLAITQGCDYGPVLITCKDGAGAVVPLAGWKSYAHVRKRSGLPLVLDLAPVIAADDAAGLVTVPALDWEVTAGLAVGKYIWDLILEDPAGIRYEPPLAGEFSVAEIATQPTT